MQTETELFRYLLWINHGHIGLYGDDGEMQCNQCGTDFKRDSADVIAKKLWEYKYKYHETIS